MTEQELKEKIAQQLSQDDGFTWALLPALATTFYATRAKSDYLRKADQILALIKESLPELAKEAGYVKPSESMELTELAEIIVNLHLSIKDTKANIQSFLLANHYVQLAEDQSLPIPNKNEYHVINWDGMQRLEAYREAQQDMLKQGWVKRAVGTDTEQLDLTATTGGVV